jgi:hypothetical protein
MRVIVAVLTHYVGGDMLILIGIAALSIVGTFIVAVITPPDPELQKY